MTHLSPPLSMIPFILLVLSLHPLIFPSFLSIFFGHALSTITTDFLSAQMIHLASKVPNFIRFLFSKALDVQEEAWNAYPYCRTVITNPGYMKDNAYIKIETLHAQDAGTNENAHNLPKNLLEKRKVD